MRDGNRLILVIGACLSASIIPLANRPSAVQASPLAVADLPAILARKAVQRAETQPRPTPGQPALPPTDASKLARSGNGGPYDELEPTTSNPPNPTNRRGADMPVTPSPAPIAETTARPATDQTAQSAETPRSIAPPGFGAKPESSGEVVATMRPAPPLITAIAPVDTKAAAQAPPPVPAPRIPVVATPAASNSPRMTGDRASADGDRHAGRVGSTAAVAGNRQPTDHQPPSGRDAAADGPALRDRSGAGAQTRTAQARAATVSKAPLLSTRVSTEEMPRASHAPAPRVAADNSGITASGRAQGAGRPAAANFTIVFPEGSASVSRLGIAIIEQAATNFGALTIRSGPRPIDRNRAEAVRTELLTLGVQVAVAEPDGRVGPTEVRIDVR
jgi:hypothetical protein